MSLTKTQANVIARNAIAVLDHKWVSAVCYNFGWVVQINSVDCPGMYIIYDKATNDWSVYLDPYGWRATGRTPNLALSNCRKALKERVSRLKDELNDTILVINLIVDYNHDC